MMSDCIVLYINIVTSLTFGDVSAFITTHSPGKQRNCFVTQDDHSMNNTVFYLYYYLHHVQYPQHSTQIPQYP